MHRRWIPLSKCGVKAVFVQNDHYILGDLMSILRSGSFHDRPLVVFWQLGCGSWKKVNSLILHKSWLNLEASQSRLPQIVKAFQNPAHLTALALFPVLPRTAALFSSASLFLTWNAHSILTILFRLCPLLWMSFKCPPLVHDPKPTNLCAPPVTATML